MKKIIKILGLVLLFGLEAKGQLVNIFTNKHIGNSNLTLEGDRTLTMGTYGLTFSGTGMVDATTPGTAPSRYMYASRLTNFTQLQYGATSSYFDNQWEGNTSWGGAKLQITGNTGKTPTFTLYTERYSGGKIGLRGDSLELKIITGTASTAFYPLPNTQPSTTLADSSVMVLVGNGAGGLSAVWRPKSSFGGGGGISGTGLTNRLAYWTASGAIGYENTARLDTVNNYLGIGSTAAPNSRLDVTTDGLGVTQTNTSGILLSNNTAAAVGAQQMSPGLRWRGNGWKTTATAGSQTGDFLADVLPVQGATSPTGQWVLKQSINGGAYTNRLVINSDGGIATLQASGLQILTNGGSAGGLSFNGSPALANGMNVSNSFSIIQTNTYSSGDGMTISMGSGITHTSGISRAVRLTGVFNPTSGTATHDGLALNPTINQTGGANGITRGIYINPTLTAAADWRSIETSNTTGYSIYTAAAPTYFGGNVGIGTVTADRLLHAEASDAGTNTTTYAQRLTHITSGTATTGFGIGLEFEQEGADGANDVTARINAIATDATAGTEDDKLTIDLIRAGTLTEAISISSLGYLSVSDESYTSAWDGKLDVPTKNAVFDKIESLPIIITLTPLSFADSLKTTGEKSNDYWTVPAALNGYTIKSVVYGVRTASANGGSVTVGLNIYNNAQPRAISTANALSATFGDTEVEEVIAGGGQIVTTGQMIVPNLSSDTAVTHARGLTITIVLSSL